MDWQKKFRLGKKAKGYKEESLTQVRREDELLFKVKIEGEDNVSNQLS